MQQDAFRIGVTGHRDLRPGDRAPLRANVRSVLAGLRRERPARAFEVLTGLAEGADQLVAEVALTCKVPVVAVLPLPLEVYRTTMSAAAQAGLDALLAQAARRIDLAPPARAPDALSDSDVAHSSAYEALARNLHEHCDALIALWDGEPSSRRGGTAQVVSGFGGEIYQVVTPRLSGTKLFPEITARRLRP
jgi:hypothetical protein